jgi:hypothetical protein
MSDYDIYEDMAEAWDQRSGFGAAKSGGAKKKAVPTTVGKQRVGGAAWVGAAKVCMKSCSKKCCSGPKTTPSLL